MDASLEEGIRRLVTDGGCELVHIEFKHGSGTHVLRIFIDKGSNDGINLDDCQKVSKRIGAFLDAEDSIPYRYVLEVSSPGLDRGLYSESDYVRFSGRKAKVKTTQPVENRRNFLGRIQAVGDGRVQLIEANGKEWLFPISTIEKANLEIEI